MKKHINTHISHILLDIKSLENNEYHTLSTGYPSIDEITEGIKTQMSYLITNDDYSISSELIYNLALNIASDKNVVLFIDLFESNRNTAIKFKTIATQKEITEESLSKLPIFIENDMLNFEVIVERIMNFVRFTHIKVIMISSIEQLLSNSEIESFEYQRRILSRLISLAKEFNIALIMGHGKETNNNSYSYLINNTNWILKLDKSNNRNQYNISYINERESIAESTSLNYEYSKYTFTEINIIDNKRIINKENSNIPQLSSIFTPIESINSTIRKTNTQGELCPVCGSTLIFTEGCKKCVNCEYSACGT
jgi:hypothetical protein